MIAAVANLAFADPARKHRSPSSPPRSCVGIAGATFDIVIDAYRIEILEPRQLGVGSGMSQYGWRIGSAGAGAIALVVAARSGWDSGLSRLRGARACRRCSTALFCGEPKRHRDPPSGRASRAPLAAVWRPFVEFFKRKGALLVLLFILLHKIGDTLANLMLPPPVRRTSASPMTRSRSYDVGVGFWAYLIGIFIGGMLYAQLGMKRSVLISLVLMAVSNFSFALLAMSGHSQYRHGGRDRLREFRERDRRRRASSPISRRSATCASPRRNMR